MNHSIKKNYLQVFLSMQMGAHNREKIRMSFKASNTHILGGHSVDQSAEDL